LKVGVPYSDKSNIKRWAHTDGRDLRCRGNNWFVPYKTILSRSKERPHPATFPTELAVNCIKIHAGVAPVVMLDPFLGIGHSALAAKECGIDRFIGFDIDPEYVETARRSVGIFEPGGGGSRKGQPKRARKRRTDGQKDLFG